MGICRDGSHNWYMRKVAEMLPFLLWLDARAAEESMMSPRLEAERDIKFHTPPLPPQEWSA